MRLRRAQRLGNAMLVHIRAKDWAIKRAPNIALYYVVLSEWRMPMDVIDQGALTLRALLSIMQTISDLLVTLDITRERLRVFWRIF